MIVLTLQLSPDEKPFLGISNQRAIEMVAQAMSEALSETAKNETPEFVRICREYALGRSCVGIIIVTEPPAKLLKGN